jgi:hypothetical protein
MIGLPRFGKGAVSHKHLDYYLDEFTFQFQPATIKKAWQALYSGHKTYPL